MANPTGLDVIQLALVDAGVTAQSQPASAFDSANALTRLNWMLAQWAVDNFLVYRLVTYSVTSTGAQSYTIGPDAAASINTGSLQRPNRIESAFVRQIVPSQPDLVDYPLDILESRNDYNLIATKSLTTFAEYLWYDPDFPLGVLYPWPVPEATIYSLHVTVKQVFTELALLSDEMVLPKEYFQAVYLSLVETLKMAYQLPPDQLLTTAAAAARNVVRESNTKIARLQMPPELVRPGIWNPYSNQTY